MQRKYEENNIFQKIINRELPAKIHYEDEKVICFYDINPKEGFVSFNDFVKNSDDGDIAYFFKTAQKIAENLDVKSYRIVANCGEEAGQVVFHFHLHIMGYR